MVVREVFGTITTLPIVIFPIFLCVFSKIHTQKIGQISYCSRPYESLLLYQKLIGRLPKQCPDRPERNYPNPEKPVSINFFLPTL
jgi:hypothetical protein